MAAPTFRSAGTAAQAGATTTLTVSYTLTAGDCLLVYFEVAWSGSIGSITSVVWNGSENLTLIGSVSQSVTRNGYLYGLKNPTAGAFSAVVTLSATPIISAGVAAGITAVDQTTPWGAAGTGQGASNTPSATVASTTAGNTVFCAGIAAEDYAGITMTNGTAENTQATANVSLILASRASQAGSTQVNGTYGATTVWTWVAAEFYGPAPTGAASAVLNAVRQTRNRSLLRR